MEAKRSHGRSECQVSQVWGLQMRGRIDRWGRTGPSWRLFGSAGCRRKNACAGERQCAEASPPRWHSTNLMATMATLVLFHLPR
jgi:hypothetical protein